MISVAAWTHVGRIRSHNEDVVAFRGVLLTGSPLAPVTTLLPEPRTDDDAYYIAVVDGMGGHVGGVEASALVGQRLAHARGPVEETIASINTELYDEMDRREELRSMGATVAGFRLSASKIDGFNVGDARLYRHSDGYASLLSVDDRAESGSGEITQSLGGTRQRERALIHRCTIGPTETARLLCCTDGLSEHVAFGDIQDALDELNGAQAVRRLVGLALHQGAPDNLSVVVLDVSAER
jgi:PPM family protein phosphatase